MYDSSKYNFNKIIYSCSIPFLNDNTQLCGNNIPFKKKSYYIPVKYVPDMFSPPPLLPQSRRYVMNRQIAPPRLS